MAINQLNPTTNDIAKLITNVNKVYKTQADITLTNFSGTGVPAVQSGSIFANNGTSFEVDSNATINDSGVANGWVYVKYNVSNARFEYNVTTPTWSDTKQGYYVSNDRYFFKMYKVGASDFRYKLKIKKTLVYGDAFENSLSREYVSIADSVIFSDLKYLIPDTGDIVTIQGTYPVGTTHVDSLHRSSSTNINLKTGTTTQLAIGSASGTTRTIDFEIVGLRL